LPIFQWSTGISYNDSVLTVFYIQQDTAHAFQLSDTGYQEVVTGGTGISIDSVDNVNGFVFDLNGYKYFADYAGIRQFGTGAYWSYNSNEHWKIAKHYIEDSTIWFG